MAELESEMSDLNAEQQRLNDQLEKATEKKDALRKDKLNQVR